MIINTNDKFLCTKAIPTENILAVKLSFALVRSDIATRLINELLTQQLPIVTKKFSPGR
jgi:hypothetical protein